MRFLRFAFVGGSSRRNALALAGMLCAVSACSTDGDHANATTHAGTGGVANGGAQSAQSGGAASGGVPATQAGGAAGTRSGGTANGSGGDANSGGGSGRTAAAGRGGAASGSSGAPAVGGEGGSSGASDGSPACTAPSHVLPLNPSNPQDGITLGAFYVDTDTWNAAGYSVTQTMYVCDYDSWYVVANMNDDAGDGAVKTYPNVHEDFDAAPAIASFSTISSSFSHRGPHVGIYEFAYDIWLNGVASAGSTEVMIWTDNYNQVPSGANVESVTFDGRAYRVFKSGSYIAFVASTNTTSGTVNLLSFFNHIVEKGWIPSTSTLGAIDYGVELVSTGGADATFELTDFSLTTR